MRSPILHSWHVALSLVIVVVVGLFSSPLALVQAQYSSVPLASCPAGYDCVGRQLEPYLGTNNSIDCSNGQFVGYTCAYSGSEALTFCPSGYYCPTPTMQVECPSGHWCHQGSTNPQKCGAGAICGEGKFQQRLITPLIVVLAVSVALIASYQYGHYRFRQRAQAALASKRGSIDETAIASSQAGMITVKSAPAPGRSASVSVGVNSGSEYRTLPQLNVEIDRVCVRVKDANATDASKAAQQAAGETGSELGTKTILHNVTGKLRGGRLTAIMGPSGSGKTTFLSALLNKVPISSGSIEVNHMHSVADVIRMNVVGFVPQADTMLDMLTVRDLVEHSAFMRLPGDMSREAKLRRVASVLELVGISHIADSVVGNDLKRGISGGERKRVSIAMEMVADPLLLFLDEPTSGLDSAASLQVCAGLAAVAATSKVVCCVIHQPRWEIFASFDDVLLLGRGGIPIYFGPVKGLRDFFSSMGLRPPPNCNPADFYIDCISDEEFLNSWKEGGHEEVRRRAIASGRMTQLTARKSYVLARQAALSSAGGLKPSGSFSGASVAAASQVEIDSAVGGVQDPRAHSNSNTQYESSADGDAASAERRAKLAAYSSHTPITPTKPASFIWQVWYLFYRCLLVDVRDASAVTLDSLIQILPPVALAINSLSTDTYSAPLPQSVADTCFSMIGKRCQDDLLKQSDFTTSTFFWVMIMGVAAILWGVGTFGRPMAVFFRDRIAGQSTVAYFFAKCIYDLIHLCRMVLIYTSIFYLMSAPRGSFSGWFAGVWMVFWAAMGMSYLISILVPFNRATTIGIVCSVAVSVTSGTLPQLNVVDNWYAMQFFWYLSYDRWGAEAFTILNSSGQPTDGRMHHAGTAVGYDLDNYSLDIGIIFLIGIMWRAFAFIALWRSKPRTEF